MEISVMAVIRAYRPYFRNPHDKIAFAAHASFLASGYILTATGNRAYSDNALSSSGQEEVGIDGWNDLDDCYGFIYTKTEKESKKSVLMKCLIIGDNLAIDVLPSGDEQKGLIDLQINVNDYVSDDGGSSTGFADMYKNFKGLIEHLDSGILSKLDSTTRTKKLDTTSRSQTTQRGEGSEHNEVQPAPGVHIEPEPYYSGTVYPPIHPAGTGDLYPGPGAGVYPMRGINDGSMLVGPNDPRWFGGIGGGEHPGFPGRIPGVPPGARFDPYGPPGMPGFEPNRFMRNPRRPHGGAHPDIQHFPDADYI
ncbi:putative proteasome inhibitor isoform X2 [Tasmannia lanceolata]|uniref:putative proteasome inhibitor isoform X2 n=1 Tax=Tasmannia lanceolata TaxID=3420 RepID=UPI004064727F